MRVIFIPLDKTGRRSGCVKTTRSLRPVDPIGLENRRSDDLQPPLVVDPSPEARSITLVASAPHLARPDEQDVGIAIDVDRLDHLDVPRSSPLVPRRLPRPRIEMGLPGRQRLSDRGFVHPCHHQDFARLRILDDRRDQAIGGPLDRLEKGQVGFVHGWDLVGAEDREKTKPESVWSGSSGVAERPEVPGDIDGQSGEQSHDEGPDQGANSHDQRHDRRQHGDHEASERAIHVRP